LINTLFRVEKVAEEKNKDKEGSSKSTSKTKLFQVEKKDKNSTHQDRDPNAMDIDSMGQQINNAITQNMRSSNKNYFNL